MTIAVEFHHQSVKLLEKGLQRTGEIELSSVGTSMYPLLRTGDICTFQSIDVDSLHIGDIVLFATNSGELIGHRLRDLVTTPEGRRFVFKGDTNFHFDPTVPQENLIGKLTCIQKRRFRIPSNGVFAIALRWMVLTFPWYAHVVRHGMRWAGGVQLIRSSLTRHFRS